MEDVDAPKRQTGPVENPARETECGNDSDRHKLAEIAMTQRMLAKVAAAEIQMDYFPQAGEMQCDILLSLPYNCYLNGHFTFFPNGETSVYIGNWHVDEKLQRNGIGRRLMEEFIKQAVLLGVTDVYTCAVSPEGLKGVSSFFGFENLKILGKDAAKCAGMSLQQLLDLMVPGSGQGFPLHIKMK